MKNKQDDERRQPQKHLLVPRQRKLVLSREELRKLQTIDKEALALVAGGRIVQSLVDNCIVGNCTVDDGLVDDRLVDLVGKG